MKPSTQVRLVDGRMMIEIPSAVVETLSLMADQTVQLKSEGTRLTVETGQRLLSTLADLLADCDPSAPDDPDILEWQNTPADGREIV